MKRAELGGRIAKRGRLVGMVLEIQRARSNILLSLGSFLEDRRFPQRSDAANRGSTALR